MTGFLEQWRVEQGYSVVVPLGDGLAFVGALTMGQGVLGVGDLGGVAERFTYRSVLLTEAALREWQDRGFVGEPLGWHRHQPSGRRRPDGDPSREYVQP